MELLVFDLLTSDFEIVDSVFVKFLYLHKIKRVCNRWFKTGISSFRVGIPFYRLFRIKFCYLPFALRAANSIQCFWVSLKIPLFSFTTIFIFLYCSIYLNCDNLDCDLMVSAIISFTIIFSWSELVNLDICPFVQL